MTCEEAANILDPETSYKALEPWRLDCTARYAVAEEACRVAAKVLREKAKEEQHGTK